MKIRKDEGIFFTVTDNTRDFLIILQNSPYFCVLKYARAVKQKVWSEAGNGERDWRDGEKH